MRRHIVESPEAIISLLNVAGMIGILEVAFTAGASQLHVKERNIKPREKIKCNN